MSGIRTLNLFFFNLQMLLVSFIPLPEYVGVFLCAIHHYTSCIFNANHILYGFSQILKSLTWTVKI